MEGMPKVQSLSEIDKSIKEKSEALKGFMENLVVGQRLQIRDDYDSRFAGKTVKVSEVTPVTIGVTWEEDGEEKHMDIHSDHALTTFETPQA